MRNKIWVALLIFGFILNATNCILFPVKADAPKSDGDFWYTPPLQDGDIFASPQIIYHDFWEFIADYALWGLQYKQGSRWVWMNDSLSAGFIERHDRMKVWLNFTTGPAGTYRLNLRVNLALMNWTYRANTSIFKLTYISYDNPYVFSLNISDLKRIGGLTFLWGVINQGGNNYFQFNVTRANCPAGRQFNLDPEYTVDAIGYADATGFGNERRLCRTSDGILHTIFIVSYAGTYYATYARSVNGGVTWSGKKNISTVSTYITSSMCVDGNDYLYTVFSVIVGGKYIIRFSKSTDKGLTWSQPTNITSSGGAWNQLSPSIAVDSAGKLHCVWMGYNSAYTAKYQIRYSNSTDNGTSWAKPRNLTAVNYNQDYPCIGISKNNTVIIAWYGTSASYTTDQIWFTRSFTRGNTWRANVVLTRVNYGQQKSSIAIDVFDRTYLVWTGRHSGSTTNYQVRYTVSLNLGTTWLNGAFKGPENLTRVTTWTQLDGCPTISLDSRNCAHVVWAGASAVGGTYRIRYTNYNLTNARWLQNPINLTDDANAHSNPSVMWQYYPKIGSNNNSKTKTGYCFVFTNVSVVKYMGSLNLSFDGAYRPTASAVSPANSSTGVARFTRLSFIASDLDGNIMSVTWQSSPTGAVGSYTTYQVNTSVTSGSTVRDMNFSIASWWNTTYWWKIWLNDGTGNNRSYWYSFRTCGRPVVLSNPVPANGSSCIELNPMINITASDPEGKKFDLYWYTNHSHQLSNPLRPDGLGDNAQLDNNDGTGPANNYEYVDEIICDNLATYVYTASAIIKYDTYRLPNVTADQFHIFNVAVHMMCMNTWSDTVPYPIGVFRACIVNGTSAKSIGPIVNPPQDNVFYEYSYIYDDNPWSGVEWTWADINNLQAGVGIRCTSPGSTSGYCSQIWLTINDPNGFSYIWDHDNLSVSNGTYHLDWEEFNESCTSYWWMVEGWDGENDTMAIYNFSTTGPCCGGPVSFIPSVSTRWSGSLLLALGFLCVIPFLFIWRRRRKVKEKQW